MHVVTLSPEARSHMAGQLADSHSSGTGFQCAYALAAIASGRVVDVAHMMLVPHGAYLSIWIVLLGRQISTTICQPDATPERITQILQEHANAVIGSSEIEPASFIVLCDLTSSLKVAVVMKSGRYLLPVGDLPELHLVIDPAIWRPGRPRFHFELEGIRLTMPALLPKSDGTALQLLLGCTRDLVNNYRNA
ncbi:hypothetical protein EGJ27_08690 [Pseudomonas sp. v388]|uniref:hypothetical protein n=1 Tax=Pseudomonas sp. v388 TaxID=2479849 RepID=UPI000F79721C|nr:hypothetical protein [Pseudomonas sp. v388]RRV08120.1 hypothetical protein EGJ27_08690 [Pseudomonas sp. v388]